MSGMRHATISAWQREHEDPSYAAEIKGWNLRVRWRPEGAGERRGFLWEAERGSTKLKAADVAEEMEVAMAAAEKAIEEAGGEAAEASAG